MKPIIFGILNVTEDSFSDGGAYLDSSIAIEHGRAMRDADVLDIGAAASNPDARRVPTAVEINRLSSVVPAFQKEGRSLSIDTFSTEVQRWALAQGVDYLNDIRGFSDPTFYPELAGARAKLVVMHSLQNGGPATRVETDANTVVERVSAFFAARVRQLEAAGIERSRLILDPGMGFFLGSNPDASFAVLENLGRLKRDFGLPVLVSVSRKSFLRKVTGRPPQESGPATLAAELYAVHQGTDYIRTHDPNALRDALLIGERLSWTGGKP